MKTLNATDEPEPQRVWPWTINAANPPAITWSFPDTTGAMTVLPIRTISSASGAAAANNVIWR